MVTKLLFYFFIRKKNFRAAVRVGVTPAGASLAQLLGNVILRWIAFTDPSINVYLWLTGGSPNYDALLRKFTTFSPPAAPLPPGHDSTNQSNHTPVI